MDPGLLYERPLTDIAPSGPEQVFTLQRAQKLETIIADLMVGIVAAISQKDFRLWPVGVEERQDTGVVGGLARRDVDGYREADSGGAEMNLGRKPTSRAPETLSRRPPFAPAAHENLHLLAPC